MYYYPSIFIIKNNSYYSDQQSTIMYSMKLFCVKNVTSYKWDNIVDKAMGCNSRIKNLPYILMSKKTTDELVLGLIQYETIYENTICDTIKIMIDIEDIAYWKECNYFSKLKNISSILHAIVTYKAHLIFEQCIQPNLLPTSININDIPSIDYINVCSLFDSSNEIQPMILIIEERLTNLPNEFRAACQVRQDKCFLSLLSRNQLMMVHIVHPAMMQCYHSFNFHHNPHYGIRHKLLPIYKWILKLNNVKFMEYHGNEGYHSNNQITIINNPVEYNLPVDYIYNTIKTHKMKSRNISNYYVSYGYSSEYRSITGEPLLTTSIGHLNSSSDILQYILPTLSALTESLLNIYPNMSPCNVRRMKYAQRLGSNFKYIYNTLNIYEGFDISVLYSKNTLEPHCDVMNDWREGYNFISVLKSTFYDADIDDLVTLSLICYTRKAVGDRMIASNTNIM